jgi:hypothetical protein
MNPTPDLKTCMSGNSGSCWWKIHGGEEGDIASRLHWHIEHSMANPVWMNILSDALAEIESLRGFKEGVIAGRSSTTRGTYNGT